MRMGFEYFDPEKTWTWDELDTLSGHREGLTTWNMRIYLETAKLGYDTVIFDPIDYRKLNEDFEGYIRDTFSPDYAKETLRLSDALQVKADTDLLLPNFDDISICQKSYTIDEYKDLLDQDYLIATWVDMAVYSDIIQEFCAHFILVHSYDENGVIAHDPGLGSQPGTQIRNNHIKWDVFNKAIQMNTQGETGEMIAFKKEKKNG